MREQRTFRFGREDWFDAQAHVAKRVFTKALEETECGYSIGHLIDAPGMSRGAVCVNIDTPPKKVAAQALYTALDTMLTPEDIVSVDEDYTDDVRGPIVSGVTVVALCDSPRGGKITNETDA